MTNTQNQKGNDLTIKMPNWWYDPKIRDEAEKALQTKIKQMKSHSNECNEINDNSLTEICICGDVSN